MTLPRLLAVAVLFATSLAFAQDKQANPNSLAVLQAAPLAQAVPQHKSANAVEPWRFVPDEKAGSGKNPLDRMQLDQFQISQHKYPNGRYFIMNGEKIIVPDWDGQLTSDVTCYTMRSYRVARDSKNSDSTHPAGYTTCQPTSRYRLKTTEQRIEIVEPVTNAR